MSKEKMFVDKKIHLDYLTVKSDDIKILPFMRGFGNVADLHHVMSQDAVLKTMVEEFVNFGNTFTTESTEKTETNNNQPSTINGILDAA